MLLSLTAIALLFSGCMDTPFPEKSPKIFEGEDQYILFGLEAESIHDFNSSASLFLENYEKTQKSEYLYRSLQGMLEAHDYQKLLTNATRFQNRFKDRNALQRYEILALLNLEKTDDALSIALKLVHKTKQSSDFLLASDIYLKQKRIQEAADLLLEGYKIKYDESLLVHLSTLMFADLHKESEAIDLLETRIKNYGCSKAVCLKLAAFYGTQENVDGMVKNYVRLYNIEPSDEVAQNIIKLYGYQKEYSKLMLFLEDCHCDDELLLQLYVDAKLFNKASELAKKLYDLNFETKFLAQSAIYLYESAGNKIDKEKLSTVVKDLQNAVEKDPQDIYLNYLGYLLIDKDLDVPKGIEYVKKALKSQKDSAFYLDSLAWGYYKQRKCEDAKRIMDQVVKKIGLEEPEIKEHYQLINKCKKEHK